MASTADHNSGSSQQKSQRRVSKKLQKKHLGEDHARIDIPERLRDDDDDDEDDIDLEQRSSQGPPQFMNMNQSIFGLIANAGTRLDFTERFDGSSSEDEEGEPGKASQDHDLSQTTILQRPQKEKKAENHKRKLSGHRLLKSLPALPRLKSKSKREKSKLSNDTTAMPAEKDEDEHSGKERTSLSEPPEIKLTREDSRLAPVMSRMLEARAEISDRPSFDMGRGSTEVTRSSESSDATPLAKRLMQIFDFDAPEQVIEGQSTTTQTPPRPTC